MNTTGHNWSSGPIRARQRSLGKNKPQKIRASHDLVRRLGVEATLGESMYGDDFPMDWNHAGTLLAVACETEDYDTVSVWDVFKQREVYSLEAGDNPSGFPTISCVKFVPGTDTQVVVSGEGGLRLVDMEKKTISTLSDVPYNDTAIHPSEPQLIWSVNEDKCDVSCCDMRQAHSNAYRHPYREPCRIAINPLRSEVLALGSTSGDAQLIDRRKLPASGCELATLVPVYDPSDLLHSLMRSVRSLAFNSDGSELLFSVYGEAVYLFNTHEPWEKYESFELTIAPLMSDEPELIAPSFSSKLKPYSYLKEQQHIIEMTDKVKTLCDYILSRDSTFRGPNNIIDYINGSLDGELQPNSDLHSLQDENIIDYLNILLEKLENCPHLYQARAAALIRRARRGDYYQALRDCCCALALQDEGGEDQRLLCYLSSTLVKLEKKEDVYQLWMFVEHCLKSSVSDYNDDDRDNLIKSRETLLAFIKTFLSSEEITKLRNSPSNHSESALSEASRSESNDSKTSLSSEEFTKLRISPSGHSESALSEASRSESNDSLDHLSSREFDYSRRFHGVDKEHFPCRGVGFFGSKDEFVIGGCNKGNLYIWDKKTTNIVKTVSGQEVSNVLPHPSISVVATSGCGHTVKLWSPISKEGQDVE